MRLLLDTHVFLWYVGGDARVEPALRRAIANADSAYLSVASAWEMTITYQLEKLHLPEVPHPWIAVQRERHGIESLPVDEASVSHLAQLPLHHRDPFDRLLVCQALEYDLEIVTVDPVLSKYPAKIFRVGTRP
jgi:PIN domain nuclease of toxin-antitoxin system